MGGAIGQHEHAFKLMQLQYCSHLTHASLGCCSHFTCHSPFAELGFYVRF